MTKHEQYFYETIKRQLPKIASELSSISGQLKKLNDQVKVKQETSELYCIDYNGDYVDLSKITCVSDVMINERNFSRYYFDIYIQFLPNPIVIWAEDNDCYLDPEEGVKVMRAVRQNLLEAWNEYLKTK